MGSRRMDSSTTPASRSGPPNASQIHSGKQLGRIPAAAQIAVERCCPVQDVDLRVRSVAVAPGARPGVVLRLGPHHPADGQATRDRVEQLCRPLGAFSNGRPKDTTSNPPSRPIASMSLIFMLVGSAMASSSAVRPHLGRSGPSGSRPCPNYSQHPPTKRSGTSEGTQNAVVSPAKNHPMQQGLSTSRLGKSIAKVIFSKKPRSVGPAFANVGQDLPTTPITAATGLEPTRRKHMEPQDPADMRSPGPGSKGHTGDPDDERADELAVLGAYEAAAEHGGRSAPRQARPSMYSSFEGPATD